AALPLKGSAEVEARPRAIRTERHGGSQEANGLVELWGLAGCQIHSQLVIDPEVARVDLPGSLEQQHGLLNGAVVPKGVAQQDDRLGRLLVELALAGQLLKRWQGPLP